jgi:hypothetical protein
VRLFSPPIIQLVRTNFRRGHQCGYQMGQEHFPRSPRCLCLCLFIHGSQHLSTPLAKNPLARVRCSPKKRKVGNRIQPTDGASSAFDLSFLDREVTTGGDGNSLWSTLVGGYRDLKFDWARLGACKTRPWGVKSRPFGASKMVMPLEKHNRFVACRMWGSAVVETREKSMIERPRH